MAALANSYADNLLVRAGDVPLKERKPLVLLVREVRHDHLEAVSAFCRKREPYYTGE